MEKYYHLNAEQEQDNGAFLDNPYPFDSSSPLGFSSFESITDHKPLLPLLFDNPYQTSTSLISHPFPIFNTSIISNDFHLKPDSSLESITSSTTFKVPKTEPTEFDNISNQPSSNQLPNLRSVEENLGTVAKLETEPPYQLNSALSPCATRLKYVRQRELGRQRRQRVREKIQSLKELLPTRKKRIDTATVLENAGKYIKFLEAQVSVLKGMPVDDCLVTENVSLGNGGALDRNRVLQMVVNSEVSQEKMSSEGMCVYSVEQLVQMIGRLFTSEEASVLVNSMLFSSFAPL